MSLIQTVWSRLIIIFNILAVNRLTICVKKEADGQTGFFELLVKIIRFLTFRQRFTKKLDAENEFSSNAGFLIVIKKFIFARCC